MTKRATGNYSVSGKTVVDGKGRVVYILPAIVELRYPSEIAQRGWLDNAAADMNAMANNWNKHAKVRA